MSAKCWDSHQNLGTWSPQPSGGHSSFHIQHTLRINFQTDLWNAKGWAGNQLSTQRETKKSKKCIFSTHEAHLWLSHESQFLPPSKTRAEVCTQVSPILDKWPNYKLRDNLSFPLCFKEKRWWPLHHAQIFHAQITLPRDQVFSEKEGVATHLSMETCGISHTGWKEELTLLHPLKVL